MAGAAATLLKAGAAALAIAALALGLRWFADPVHRIAGLQGPETATPLGPATPPAQPGDFGTGGSRRLALLVTDTAAPWLPLALGLQTIGIPFLVTTDAQQAARHAVVLAYPTLSGRLLAPGASEALRRQVAGGGTLVAFEVLGGGLEDVFGLAAVHEGAERTQLAWTDDAAARWGFTEPEERVIPLGNAVAPFRSPQWVAGTAQVHARFGDGTPALLEQAHGRGRAYLLGFDAGAFIGSTQQGRRGPLREYVNAFEPGVDVLLRWLKAVYRQGEPAAVTLGTVPGGRPLAVMLTHDVDYSASIRNAQAYAAGAAARQVRATFFVQAKYVRDWNDDSFFDAEGLAQVRQLQAQGGEIASHSVAHSPTFAAFPPGTGDERYPGYAPAVRSREETRGGTLLGELRVSRFLLEHAAPLAPVRGFRPGHLAYPFALPQALQATGYRYSSALAAGMAQSHLPFRLTADRGGRAPVDVHEFPITLEDERVRPMDTVLLPRALEVARKLARYGGTCVVLSHPNVLEDKLRFQDRFLPAVQAMGAWVGPLGDYAAWWRARDGLQWDVAHADGDRPTLQVSARQAIAGVPLQLAPGWRIAGAPQAMGATAVVDVPAGASTFTLERVR